MLRAGKVEMGMTASDTTELRAVLELTPEGIPDIGFGQDGNVLSGGVGSPDGSDFAFTRLEIDPFSPTASNSSSLGILRRGRLNARLRRRSP